MAHLFGDAEFWVLLAVVVFLIIVWKPGRRAIIGALDARAQRIKQELDAARNLARRRSRRLRPIGKDSRKVRPRRSRSSPMPRKRPSGLRPNHYGISTKRCAAGKS